MLEQASYLWGLNTFCSYFTLKIESHECRKYWSTYKNYYFCFLFSSMFQQQLRIFMDKNRIAFCCSKTQEIIN